MCVLSTDHLFLVHITCLLAEYRSYVCLLI